MNEEQPYVVIAEARIKCPTCNEEIHVPIHGRLIKKPLLLELETAPDMNELWKHWWTHTEEIEE